MDGIRKIGLRFALFSAFLMVLGGIFGATPAAAQTGGVALWTATVGSSDEDLSRGVATDAQGSVYVAGSVNTRNAFAARYDAAGGLLWYRVFSGAGMARANDVAVEAGGSALVIGTFAGQIDFDPDPNATYHLNSNEDSEDIFLLKLDSGGRFVWAIGLGSKQSDSGEAVFVDTRGFVYTTGGFEESMDADPNPNKEYLLHSEGDDDIFVIRYNNDGTLARAWSMGGGDDAIGRDITADGAGNVYIAGDFLGKIDLDQDELEDEQHSAGKEDIFLVKYNDNAGWTWSIVVGGREEDERPAVALDEAGDVYLTGTFEAAAAVRLKNAGAVFTLTTRGQEDVLLAKFSRDGGLLWATGIGGPGSDRGEDVLTGNRGDIFVTGSFQNAVDFNPGEGQVFLSSAGSDDVFVGRYATTGAFYAARSIGGALEDIGRALARDAENNVIVGGSFQGSVDFDPSAATDVRNAVGGLDGFVTKLARDETPIGPTVAFLPLLSAYTVAVSAAR